MFSDSISKTAFFFMFATPKYFFLWFTPKQHQKQNERQFFMIQRGFGSYFWLRFYGVSLPCHVTCCFSLIFQPPGLLAGNETLIATTASREWSELMELSRNFSSIPKRVTLRRNLCEKTQTTNCKLIWCMILQHLFYFIFSAQRDKLL